MNVLDAARARTLGAIGPLAPSLLRDRERRIAVYGLVAIAAAFALTAIAPSALLALGPIALGAPHLAADVRYLVARTGLYHRRAFWAFVAAPAAATWIHPHAWLSLLAPVGAALIARTSLVRRVVAGSVAGALVVLALQNVRVADLALAHAHNAIAIGIFWLWSRGRSARVVVLAFFVFVVAIALGALDGAPLPAYAADLAPFADVRLATRAVLLFAFAQSVHYAVWLRLIPEADRPRPGLRSFARSFEALRADLGLPLCALFGGLGVALAIGAFFSLGAARDGYLRLAIFHGPLELGAMALLLLEKS